MRQRCNFYKKGEGGTMNLTSKPPPNIVSQSASHSLLEENWHAGFQSFRAGKVLGWQIFVENSHPIYAWCPAPHNSLGLYYIKTQIHANSWASSSGKQILCYKRIHPCVLDYYSLKWFPVRSTFSTDAELKAPARNPLPMLHLVSPPPALPAPPQERAAGPGSCH